ncbi:MAG: hypothetical protein L3K23_07405 [Thermoplasmata archaeon]|nr:hypothetical protein [Thermoplasmata archaeon]
MALFSEVDWVILLGVAAFLVFGQNSGAFVRQVGRWYGRAMKIKAELLGELRQAADLPSPVAGATPSIRATLLEWEPRTDGTSVTTTELVPAYASVPSGGWATARTPSPGEPPRGR